VVGSSVYVIGGEHVARTPINSDIHTLDLSAATKEWKTLSPSGTAPSERIAHSQAVIGTGIYVFGGRQGVQIAEAPLNDMHRFDTATQTWAEVTPSNPDAVPCTRSFHAMCAAGKHL
jgi:N-acetylneuraminic acid mutarotase